MIGRHQYGLPCKLFKDRIKNEALIAIYDIATPFYRTIMSLLNIKFILKKNPTAIYLCETLIFSKEIC